VGGVRVEYAIEFVPCPVATHVPFPNVIPKPADPKLLPVEFGIPTHDSDVGGLAREYAIVFVPLVFGPSPQTTHTPFPYAISRARVLNVIVTPLKELPVGIPTQLDAIGGVIVEYAMLFVPSPTATHVPFAYAIFHPLVVNVFELFGIPTQLEAVGGFTREYAILFVPSPTATTIFP
jgi:hypothetical protein